MPGRHRFRIFTLVESDLPRRRALLAGDAVALRGSIPNFLRRLWIMIFSGVDNGRLGRVRGGGHDGEEAGWEWGGNESTVFVEVKG